MILLSSVSFLMIDLYLVGEHRLKKINPVVNCLLIISPPLKIHSQQAILPLSTNTKEHLV